MRRRPPSGKGRPHGVHGARKIIENITAVARQRRHEKNAMDVLRLCCRIPGKGTSWECLDSRRYLSEQAVQSALRLSLCPKIDVRCGDRLQTLHDPAAPHCRMASIAEVLSRLPHKSTTASKSAMDMVIETLLLLGGRPGRQAHREMLTPPHIATSVAEGLKRLHLGATGALLLIVVWTTKYESIWIFSIAESYVREKQKIP